MENPAARKALGRGSRPGPWALAVLSILPFLAGALMAQGLVLGSYHLSREKGVSMGLPRALEEISGLALTADGRLYAHNDERAVFYQLDPGSGDVLKSFSAGIGGVAGDFEGLAIVGERFFLSTSEGSILETAEGRQGSAMTYRVYETGLGARCELEGLAFDPGSATFLLPCKNPRDRELEDHVVVFSLPLETMRPLAVPRVFIPLEELEEFDLKDEFYPSGIEVHPGTGNLLLISAREEAILELSPRGTLLDGYELRRRIHPQPEGITFGADGSLLLADEGQGGRGRLTRYTAGKDSGSHLP